MAKHKRFQRTTSDVSPKIRDDVYKRIFDRDHEAIHILKIKGHGYIVSPLMWSKIKMEYQVPNSGQAMLGGEPVKVSEMLPTYTLNTHRHRRRVEWMKRKREATAIAAAAKIPTLRGMSNYLDHYGVFVPRTPIMNYA
jgi:hypothetical protein